MHFNKIKKGMKVYVDDTEGVVEGVYTVKRAKRMQGRELYIETYDGHRLYLTHNLKRTKSGKEYIDGIYTLKRIVTSPVASRKPKIGKPAKDVGYAVTTNGYISGVLWHTFSTTPIGAKVRAVLGVSVASKIELSEDIALALEEEFEENLHGSVLTINMSLGG